MKECVCVRILCNIFEQHTCSHELKAGCPQQLPWTPKPLLFLSCTFILPSAPATSFPLNNKQLFQHVSCVLLCLAAPRVPGEGESRVRQGVRPGECMQVLKQKLLCILSICFFFCCSDLPASKLLSPLASEELCVVFFWCSCRHTRCFLF